MTRTFSINWRIECEIELDEAVIDRVDDEWRSALYNLNTPSEIAEHIAYNILMNNARLSQLDGWADMRDSQAKIIFDDIIAVESEEINQ